MGQGAKHTLPAPRSVAASRVQTHKSVCMISVHGNPLCIFVIWSPFVKFIYQGPLKWHTSQSPGRGPVGTLFRNTHDPCRERDVGESDTQEQNRRSRPRLQRSPRRRTRSGPARRHTCCAWAGQTIITTRATSPSRRHCSGS